jgi:hypothetical protein
MMAQEKMEYRNKEKTVKFQISEGEYYLKFSNENRQILVNNETNLYERNNS